MSKVLVADANENIRFIMRFNLELARHQVIEAQTGVEGLDRIKRERPDVVLVDVMMPEIDGAQTCEHLKSQPETKNIRVLLFGALPAEEMHRRAPHADCYLETPFDPGKLVDVVNHLVAGGCPRIPLAPC